MAIDFDTIAQAYHDNADYAETGSAAKAKAFVTACRRLLTVLPTEAGTRESTARFDLSLVRRELEAANQWLAAHDPAGTATNVPTGVTRADFRNFR